MIGTVRRTALYAGVGVALAAGLLLGAVMKPALRIGAHPAGPQIQAGSSGVRSPAPSDYGGLSYAPYSVEIPDYVLGTDWRKTSAWSDPPPAFDHPGEALEGGAQAEPELADEGPLFTSAAYPATSREAPNYPSLDGGAVYGQDVFAEPPAAAGLVPDAPPEAAGDTSIPLAFGASHR